MSIAEQVKELEDSIAWLKRALDDEENDRDGWRQQLKVMGQDRNHWRRRAEEAEARVAELEKQLTPAEPPSSLASVLVELSGDRIPARISIDDDSFHVLVGWPDNGERRSQLVSSINLAIESIEQFAIELYPDSAFARRRRESNSSKSSNSSPSPAAEPASTSSDIVEEFLDRFPYEWFYDVEAKRLSSGSISLGSQIAPSIAIPLCTIVNRYRRIAEAVSRWRDAHGAEADEKLVDEVLVAVYPAKETI